MVTVITKTIGAGGPPTYDYANFATAESNVETIATTAFGSTDLVANDGAIVFEAVAGTYNDTVFYISTLTTDATRNVTYKAAAGSEHGGDPTAGVILGTGANTQDVRDDYTVLSGLHINGQHLPSGDGTKVVGCILSRTSGNCAGTSAPNNTVRIVYENSVFRPAGASFGFAAYGQYGSAKVGFYNCTFSFQAGATSARGLQSYVVSPYENDFDIVNCIALVGGAVYTQSGAGTHTIAGSNNFGSSSGPFPVALQGSPYPVTATTDLDPGPGDWAIYDAATGALIDDPDNDVLAGGIGPDANPDVPTTDIVGNPRTGLTTEPGAFVLPPPPIVEEDTWTPVMVRRNDPVDVYGVLTFGDAYINAVEDTLSVTGADGTDATPAIPVGTRALWIQLVSQTGADAGETCDVSIEVSASQSLTLATLSGASTAVGNVPGLMQFPVDCLEQNDPDTPVYPRVKMVTGSSVGASDVVTIRVVAICGKQTNTTWS